MKKFLILCFVSALAAACSAKKARAKVDLPIQNLDIQSYTAGVEGFEVSSHLLMGGKDAILVDAQFRKSDAEKVVELIRSTQRRLVGIFITHAHPDHYFGLETILKAFPQAKVWARSRVAKEIRRQSAGQLKYWKPLYGDEMPAKIIFPQIFRGRLLMLEDQRIDVIDLRATESHYASALYFGSLQALISGDLLFNHVHLWLADPRGNLAHWKKSIDRAQNFGSVTLILPGHGEAGDADLFLENKKYLDAFDRILHTAADQATALSDLKREFSDYAVPSIAEISVAAHWKNQRLHPPRK